MAEKRSVWELFMKDMASRQLAALSGNADAAARAFVGAQTRIDALSGSAKQSGDQFDSLGGKIKNALAAYASFEFAKGILETTSKFQAFDNVINYTSLNAKDAAANHAFLNEVISKYKLPITETMEGFSQLNAAMLGSKLQGQGARDIFEGVSVASTALHLSAQQSQSVFLALNQMMSKGKVQAQELTLQLGQSMPGALRLAAQAMGMSTAQFMKEMEKGNIASADFLPKFAQTLMSTFSGAIPNAVQSLQSKTNEMNNAWIKVKLTLGEALMPVIEKVLGGLKWLGEGIINVTKWLDKHSGMVKQAALFVGILGVTYLTLNGYLKLNAWYNGLSTSAIIVNTLVTEGATGAMVALNMAMEANPIGIVIVALAALAAALYSVKQKYDMILDVYSSAGQAMKVKAIDQEKQSVLNLISYYKKLGSTEEEAQKKALEGSNLLLNSKIAHLNVDLASAQLALRRKVMETAGNGPIGAIYDYFNGGTENAMKNVLAVKGALNAALAQKSIIKDKSTFLKETENPAKLDKLQQGVDAITDGGRSIRNVIVNIGHGIENVNIHSATVKEGAAEMKAVFEEWFLRAINGGELALGSN